jgi:hypothetical protein
MDISRTFIVRVTTAPPRVIVEDVREGRRVVVGGLSAVGPEIAAWLGLAAANPPEGSGSSSREDSVSPRS